MLRYETLFAQLGLCCAYPEMPSAVAAQIPATTIADITDKHRRIYLQRSSSNILRRYAAG